jgi:hypothetical protein
MKKTIKFLALMVFCVSVSLAAADTEYYSYSYSRLSFVNGDVYIQRADDLGYEEGVVNLALVQGDKIGTREGRAEIHLGRNNYLRIDRQTQLDLVELPSQDKDVIQLHVLSGDIFLRINFLEREKDIEIHTPDASFYVLEEGLYRLAVRENAQTEVIVYEGTMEAAGEEGSLVIEQNESLIAAEGYFQSESGRYYTDADDNFSNWNYSRDESQARYVETRYLPSELSAYEVELAYNGRWVYEAPYGHVWVPRVRYSDWRPYHYGRWVWYPIIGWTWISYDSWGWCTYRYGRWHWRASLGWYWIPSRVWGPAWVHWYHGYDHIGWTPLSYWNRPVVIVNNNFYGRYNDRYYPSHSRALTVVHKTQLQARFVSKVALSQNSVRQISKMSLSARQPDIRPMVDRSSAQYTAASKALSRSNLRQVQRGYTAGRATGVISRGETTPVRNSAAGSRTAGVVKQSINRTGGMEGAVKSGISSRASSTRTTAGTVSARSIKRYGSTSQRTASVGRVSSSRAPAGTQKVTSTGGSTARSSGTISSRSSSSSQSVRKYAPSSRPATAGTRSTVKRTPSRSPAPSTSVKKDTASSRAKSTAKSVIKRFSPSSSSASSRGRSYTAPSRSTTRRVTSSSSTRLPSSRSTVSSRSSSSRAVYRSPSSSRTRAVTPSRSSISSRTSVRRSTPARTVGQSSSRTPSRSAVTSRSSSSRTPSRSSMSSRSSSSRSVSRSSGSSRARVSRSSSSKRVKK